LGVTREWVRKIEIRAVHRLHSNEHDDSGLGFLGRSTRQSIRRPGRAIPPHDTSAGASRATKSSRAAQAAGSKALSPSLA
jgi:hypothetical protein